MKANQFIKNEYGAQDGAGSFILLFLSVFIGCIFGLALTSSFVGFCNTASYSFNNTTNEAIMDVMLQLILPLLWVVLCVMGLAGAMYGVWRIARRL